MACRFALSRAARAYSTKVSALPVEELKLTKLANGVTVATQETFSPLATIAVTVNAGARHETAATLGAAAYLKATAFQSSKDFSSFGLTREAEAIGAKLSVHATRENITFVIAAPRSHQDLALKLVSSAATKQLFYPWEIREQDERVEQQLHDQQSSANATLIDAAHQLAFRRTLGRSAFIPAHQIGHVSSDALKAFYADRFVGSEVSVVATGVSHASLLEAATAAVGHLAPKSVSTQAAKFLGSGQESRTVTSSSAANFAFAFNAGASRINAQLLSLILANPAAVKYGSSASKIGNAFNNAGVSATASAFSNFYTDAGLFGVAVNADASAAEQAVHTTVATLKDTFQNGVTEAQLTRAKNLLSGSVLGANSFERTYLIASNLAQKQSIVSLEAVADAIQATTLNSLNDSIKTIASSRPVFVANGSLDSLPYFDELGC